MRMNKWLWSVVAVLPLLAAGAWQVARPTANASTAGQKGDTATKAEIASTKSDCCYDLTCRPGCTPDCPPDCLDFQATAKTSVKAAKAACCPQGECCPAEACCSDAACFADTTKATAKKTYLCPPCIFCPGW